MPWAPAPTPWITPYSCDGAGNTKAVENRRPPFTGSFALSISSFYSQIRSEEYIQAIEPTTAFHATYQDLTQIAECHPELYKFIALTLPNYLQDVEICCQILRGASAIERYSWLRNKKSNLFNRAAGKHMASFLAYTCLAEMARLIDAGQLKVIVSKVYPLEQAAEAQSENEAGHCHRHLEETTVNNIIANILQEYNGNIDKFSKKIIITHNLFFYKYPMIYFLYCSSVTFSIQSTTLPSRFSCMAIWVIAVVGEAPCQCFSPAANQTTSPGRISSMGPPSRWTRPNPAVTINV